MKNIDDDLRLLARYLEGDLSPEEGSQVETRLDNDPAFRKLYEISLDAEQAVRESGQEETRALLQKIHAEETGQKPPGKVRPLFTPRRIMALAAVLVLLITASIWLIDRPDSSPVAVFENYYNRPDFDQLRNGGSSRPLLTRAETSYRAGRYTEALQLLESYRADRSVSGSILQWIGICQIETEQFQAAEATFRQLADQENLDDDAAWYLALVYIRQDRYPQAKTELRKILSGEVLATQARQEQAGALLRELDQVK